MKFFNWNSVEQKESLFTLQDDIAKGISDLVKKYESSLKSIGPNGTLTQTYYEQICMGLVGVEREVMVEKLRTCCTHNTDLLYGLFATGKWKIKKAQTINKVPFTTIECVDATLPYVRGFLYCVESNKLD